MNEALTSLLLSIGGYAISSLLGVVVYLMKREIGRYDDNRKALEVRLQALEAAQREKWEQHAGKHDTDTEKLDARREQVNEALQRVRTDLLEHCAEANDRFLTKEDFNSSASYLTKKTDEVNRLLASIENILARR